MNLTVRAFADDWKLNANGDTERDEGKSFVYIYYLTDPQGNYLTDPQGNRLVGREYATQYPQILHALPDDFILNTE